MLEIDFCYKIYFLSNDKLESYLLFSRSSNKIKKKKNISKY